MSGFVPCALYPDIHNAPAERIMELHPERKLLLGGAVAAGAVMLRQAGR